VKFYTTRPTLVVSIPKEVEGLQFTRRSVRDSAASSDCIIDAPAGSTVYVSAPAQTLDIVSPPMIKAGWTQIDDGKLSPGSFSLFKYEFTKAQRVTISVTTPSMIVAAQKLTIVDPATQKPGSN